MKIRFGTILTFVADLFFVWVLVYYGLGGWRNAIQLIAAFGPLAWLPLGLVLFLLLYRSDYRSDLPLFIAGLALGYWGEWWGTTRGVWTYWNGATPPVYLPPLWGLGLITVFRLGRALHALLDRPLPRWADWLMAGSFVFFPLAAFSRSWSLLAAVDWRGRLDVHFYAGIVVAVVLIAYQFDLRWTFSLYVCGMLLGGMYEYLGTTVGEWVYITNETPPLWIAPLWGLAAAAMWRLAWLSRKLMEKIFD